MSLNLGPKFEEELFSPSLQRARTLSTNQPASNVGRCGGASCRVSEASVEAFASRRPRARRVCAEVVALRRRGPCAVDLAGLVEARRRGGALPFLLRPSASGHAKRARRLRAHFPRRFWLHGRPVREPRDGVARRLGRVENNRSLCALHALVAPPEVFHAPGRCSRHRPARGCAAPGVVRVRCRNRGRGGRDQAAARPAALRGAACHEAVYQAVYRRLEHVCERDGAPPLPFFPLLARAPPPRVLFPRALRTGGAQRAR